MFSGTEGSPLKRKGINWACEVRKSAEVSSVRAGYVDFMMVVALIGCLEGQVGDACGRLETMSVICT